ncbi:choice-of-anchor Q domain-containing protein [Thermodesulfobacteriota bacterium]
MNDDPLFVGGSDYHLTDTSPCINAGDDGTVTGATVPTDDREGTSRPQPVGGAIDIGAYEISLWYKDSDGDGYSDGTTEYASLRPTGYKLVGELTATSGDCNDNNSTAHLNGTEVCRDGIDQDCSGADDVCPTIDIDDVVDDAGSNGGTCFIATASYEEMPVPTIIERAVAAIKEWLY